MEAIPIREEGKVQKDPNAGLEPVLYESEGVLGLRRVARLRRVYVEVPSHERKYAQNYRTHRWMKVGRTVLARAERGIWALIDPLRR